MNRITRLLALTAVGTVVLTGCGSSGPPSDTPLAEQTVAVAFDVDGPPFAWIESGTEPIGFDIDVMEEIAERAGFTLNKKPLPFDGIIPALQAGQAQVAAAAISITDERESIVDFSIPYYRTGIVLATKADNAEINTVEDLKGRSVAVRTGTSNDLYVQGLPFADEIEIHRYNSTNDQLQAVLSGIADAAVNDKVLLDFYIAQTGRELFDVRGPLVTEDIYGYAVPKERPDLKTAIDEGLLAMTADGTYAEIYRKYFGTDPDPASVPGDIG